MSVKLTKCQRWCPTSTPLIIDLHDQPNIIEPKKPCKSCLGIDREKTSFKFSTPARSSSTSGCHHNPSAVSIGARWSGVSYQHSYSKNICALLVPAPASNGSRSLRQYAAVTHRERGRGDASMNYISYLAVDIYGNTE